MFPFDRVAVLILCFSILRSLDPTALSGLEKNIDHEQLPKLKGELQQYQQADMLILFTCKEDFEPFVSQCQVSSSFRSALGDFERSIGKIDSALFREHKKRIICVQIIRQAYGDRQSNDLVRDIIAEGLPDDMGQSSKPEKTGIINALRSILPRFSGAPQTVQSPLDARTVKTKVNEFCRGLSDVHFIERIPDYLREEPLIEPAIRVVFTEAQHSLRALISKAFSGLMSDCISLRAAMCRDEVERSLKLEKAEAWKDSFAILVQQIEESHPES